jgi:apolipoprotein D and lipocalin family protein
MIDRMSNETSRFLATLQRITHCAALSAMLAAISLAGCATNTMPDLQATTKVVDLERFMGDWYVVGSIPIDFFFASEAGAHNGVESYALNADDSIDTRYRFRQDSFTGPVKTFNPTAFVYNTETNAEWRMQFIWPFKSAYLIVYVDDDYSETIIGVPDRKFVWIMTRDPDISDERYAALLARVAAAGYDTEPVVRIPQSWPEQPVAE